MICIGESDYFRYNNPEEENYPSDNDENSNTHTLTSSFIEKNSKNNNNNVKRNVQESISNSNNFNCILIDKITKKFKLF
jgi:hypothetical protein